MMEFPKPPSPNNRTKPPEEKHDPRLTDDEMMYLFDQYLTPSHRSDNRYLLFILNYCKSRNTSQASRESNLEPSQGAYLRSRPDIHACIEAITTKAVMKYGYDANEVIERVKEIMDVDVIEFENPDGSFKTHLSQLAPETRRAIKKFKAKNLYGADANGMKIVIGQLLEVELWDKLKSAELLGREKSIFKETKKVEHDITTNMAHVLLESKRMADERALTMPRVEREALPAPEGETDESEST